MKATLSYFEFVSNGLGIWDISWHLDNDEAHAERLRLIDEEGYDPDLEGGEEGAITEVSDIEVELTPEGLLEFAREYAVDRGAC